MLRRKVRGYDGNGAGQTATAVESGANAPAVKPRWDGESRELWLGDVLVKRFKRVPTAQAIILSTFEEEGWPPRILDPLPPNGARRKARQRLRESIANLNEHLVNAVVHFESDGSGEGVRWRQVGAVVAG